MLALVCPGCRKPLQVKEESVGLQVKCPYCGQIIAIRAPAVVSAATIVPPLPPLPPPIPSQDVTAADVSPSASGELTFSGEDGREHYDFLAKPERPDEIGRLGPYRVLQVLGMGGMGIVFKAEDPLLERFVALKAMKPALAASESARKRFLREAKATAAIKHDHIVTIHQVGEERGAPFLAMEFLEGEPLDARLKREKKLPIADVLRIGREMAEGLAAAHKRGLVHRDIKPGNIWLEVVEGEGWRVKGKDNAPPSPSTLHPSPSTRVKILDFGLARAANDAHLTQSGAIVGTPAYMAPEQAKGEEVDVRCDLFSLGSVLYHLCTGRLPFKGTDTMSILMSLALETPKTPHELNGAVPSDLSALIMKLLAKNREQRPASAQEVAESLRALENERTVIPDDTASYEIKRPARRKRPYVIAGLLAGIVLLLSIITFRTKHGVLVVNVTEPDVQVLIDGEEKMVIDSKKVGRVELIPGEHKLLVKRGGEELFTESFKLKSGGEVVIDAKWTPKVVDIEKEAAEVAWRKRVAAMNAAQQVRAVSERLKELNPGFDGKVTPTVEGGVVTGLEFLTDNVTDISPVRALTGLKSLTCSGNPRKPGVGIEYRGGGQLDDLSPLKDLTLELLICHHNRVSDLSPLKNMKLKELDCRYTSVSDLSPLKHIMLTKLDFGSCPVIDLSPLKDMKLTILRFNGSRVEDLSPLKNMKLSRLECGYWHVSDLSPLSDMKLDYLDCGFSRVSDLSLLKNMNLTTLICIGTRVTDLSIVKTMPLVRLECNFKPDRDTAILRSIKTLEMINLKPAAEFWKEVDAKQADKKP